ncbi:MAG: GAF domain-containing sensor histidine kinase [Candidatus Sumerlaeia bacterium]
MERDRQISIYREAAMALKRGEFNLDLPLDPRDDLAGLGQILIDLGQIMQARFAEMSRLLAITERINAGLMLEDVLNYIYDSCHAIIPYQRIGLALLDEGGENVYSRWARAGYDEVRLPAGYKAPLEGSSLRRIIETGEPRIINDLEAHLAAHPESDSTRRILSEGIRSSLTCPLVANGKPIGFLFFSSTAAGTYRDAHVGLFRQIAGQVALAIEKSRLYEELYNLNQVKNRFVAMTAHDLRSPLGIFRGYLHLFLNGIVGEVPPNQRALLERMNAKCIAMTKLIDATLDIGMIESGRIELNPSDVGLGEFLREAVESHELLARAKFIRIKLDEESAPPAARFDPDRIGQVLSNLITNAIKFSHPETEITLSCAGQDREVVISVIDQGQGIPQAELPGLFSDFGKTSTQPTAGERSTGLGLAIAKRIVEAHGGRIWVTSRVGVGTTFAFALPIQGAGTD